MTTLKRGGGGRIPQIYGSYYDPYIWGILPPLEGGILSPPLSQTGRKLRPLPPLWTPLLRYLYCALKFPTWFCQKVKLVRSGSVSLSGQLITVAMSGSTVEGTQCSRLHRHFVSCNQFHNVTRCGAVHSVRYALVCCPLANASDLLTPVLWLVCGSKLRSYFSPFVDQISPVIS